MRIEFDGGRPVIETVELPKAVVRPLAVEPTTRVGTRRATTVRAYLDWHEWGVSLLAGHRGDQTWLEVAVGPFAIIVSRRTVEVWA